MGGDGGAIHGLYHVEFHNLGSSEFSPVSGISSYISVEKHSFSVFFKFLVVVDPVC